MANDLQILGMPFGAFLAVLVLLFLLPTAGAFVIVDKAGARSRLKGRISSIATGQSVSSQSGKAQLKRNRQIKNKLQDTANPGSRNVNRRIELRLRIERAGLDWSLKTFYILSGCSAVLGVAIYIAMGYPPIFVIAVLPVMGVGFPRYVLNYLAKRRQKAFTKLFADAIDVIVRGIKSGLPVGECLNIIASESPEPVSTEFKLLVEAQRLGMTMKQALERACRRMPSADMKFFAVVLNLQQQTGGNLAETLSNLSGILRARKKMGDKVRAMSSEARMTATIIGSMPFLISLIIYVINPEYISLLWTDPMGKRIFYGGLGWMSTGVFIMRQMITFEI
ncbi:MAG TPA: type II secretion system F family protein [Candidatus Cybelea sp.]|nr:type II secretion system F family protein [Candidatus Cybelea sp.]